MRVWPFGALPRSGFDVLRGRRLVASLPALERLFTATPVGQRHRTRATAQSKSVATNHLCRQLLQQRLRFLQIARVEPFGEPAVNWSQQFVRLLHLALVAPEAREAHGSAC